MKTISVKIDEAIFRELNIRRGRDTISEYLRRIIDAHLTASGLPNVNKVESIRALAIYLTELVKLGNPPAYSTQSDKIKNLFSQFMNRIEEGRNEK